MFEYMFQVTPAFILVVWGFGIVTGVLGLSVSLYIFNRLEKRVINQRGAARVWRDKVASENNVVKINKDTK
jgi:hypothetical protein